MVSKNDNEGKEKISFHVYHPAGHDGLIQDDDYTWINIDFSKNENKQYKGIKEKVDCVLCPKLVPGGTLTQGTNDAAHGLSFLLYAMAKNVRAGKHLQSSSTKILTHNQVSQIIEREYKTRSKRFSRGIISNNFGVNTRKRLANLLANKNPHSVILLHELQQCLPGNMRNDFQRELFHLTMWHAEKVGLINQNDATKALQMNAEDILDNPKLTDQQRFYALMQQAAMSKGRYRLYCQDRALKLLSGFCQENMDYLVFDLQILIYKYLGDELNPDQVNTNDHKILMAGAEKPVENEQQLKQSIYRSPNPDNVNESRDIIDELNEDLQQSNDVGDDERGFIINIIKRLEAKILSKGLRDIPPKEFELLLAEELNDIALKLTHGYYRETLNNTGNRYIDLPPQIEFMLHQYLDNSNVEIKVKNRLDLDTVLTEVFNFSAATRAIFHKCA
ncbi:MAG: hypothetical protein GY821_09795 [Gammaproteobacteria bacterium]|nr:hypothetical protein [Gammaproteobacteria bacterium]